MTNQEFLEMYAKEHTDKHGKEFAPIYEMYLISHACKEVFVEKDGESVPSGMPDTSGANMGFYYELDTAMLAMNENWCDIHERCYEAGFILCRFPGLYNSVSPWLRIYFLWDEDRCGFFEADEPELFAHVAL